MVDLDAPPATVSYDIRPISRGPVGLEEVTGVWTGAEYLIFGGFSPKGPSHAGSLRPYRDSEWGESSEGTPWTTPGYGYDPNRDRWRSLPGRPLLGTSGNSPVGWHCGRVLMLTDHGIGYRYHPKRGTFEATSTEGAPKVCLRKTMRIHGPYAIIWGCEGCGAHVYDRRSDTWSWIGDDSQYTCDHVYDGVVGQRYVALHPDGSGGYSDIGSDRWQPIAAPELSMSVVGEPVGDADALHVLGRSTTNDEPRSAILRYEFRTGSWSREPMNDFACDGRLTTSSEGVLFQADNWSVRDPFSCAYDLANPAQVAIVPANERIHGTVTIVGDDQLFVWGTTDWFYGSGEEIQDMPVVSLSNRGWVIDLRVER